MHGPQTVRRYRRDTGQVDPPPGVGGGPLAFDLLDACELDLVVGGLARAVGAQAGLLAVSDQVGQSVEVLAAWGAADVLDDLPAPPLRRCSCSRTQADARAAGAARNAQILR
jgi:hypothetical protein